MSFVDSLKKGLFGSEDDYDDQYMDDGPQMVNNNNGLGVAGNEEEDEPEEGAAPKRNGKVVNIHATTQLSGVAYANNGQIKRVANSTFIITPYNVDIMGDLLDELENNGAFY